MISQSDSGKRKVKLMLVRPQKDFTIIWALHGEITIFRFLILPLPFCGAFLTELVRAKSKNRKIEIFSGSTQMIVKSFQGRSNISLMFLFPQSDCGIIILDFEKIAFFDSKAIFGPFAAPGKSFFTWRTLLKIPLLFEKKEKMKHFLKIF